MRPPVSVSSGVFEQAFGSAVVWLTALLSAWMAVLPSMTVRALSVILKVHDKHKVRHKKANAKASSVRASHQPRPTWRFAYASRKSVGAQRGSSSP